MNDITALAASTTPRGSFAALAAHAGRLHAARACDRQNERSSLMLPHNPRRCALLALASLLLMVDHPTAVAEVPPPPVGPWSRLLLPISTSAFRAVAAGPTQIVSVGDKGTLALSHDGHTWERRAVPTQEDLKCVAYGNGTFLAAAPKPEYGPTTFFKSPDGITWTAVNTIFTNYVTQLIFADGVFVAGYTARNASDWGIATSSDGEHWQNHITGRHYSLTYANNRFLVSAQDYSLWTSADGFQWTRVQNFTVQPFKCIAYGNGRYVAFGVSTGLSTSEDAVTWTHRWAPASWIAMLSFGNGRFVGQGGGGNMVALSTNGIDWTYEAVTLTPPLGVMFSQLTFLHDVFWIVGSSGFIASSPDGRSWSQPLSTFALSRVVYSNGRFYGMHGNRISSSSDGNLWTHRYLPGEGPYNDLVTSGANVIAVGKHGSIVRSSDGLFWLPVDTGTKSNLSAVTVTANGLVSVGDGGTVLSSLDGEAWIQTSIGKSDCNLFSVAFGNGKYVVFGKTPTFTWTFTSNNGLSWRSFVETDGALALKQAS